MCSGGGNHDQAADYAGSSVQWEYAIGMCNVLWQEMACCVACNTQPGPRTQPRTGGRLVPNGVGLIAKEGCELRVVPCRLLEVFGQRCFVLLAGSAGNIERGGSTMAGVNCAGCVVAATRRRASNDQEPLAIMISLDPTEWVHEVHQAVA